MTTEIRKRFFENTSETGRFTVTSNITGISYFIEVIDNAGRPADWGHN